MTRTPTAQEAIPLAQPNVSDRERELVAEVLAGDVLAMGPYTDRFEEAIAALSGRRHAVACSSGTAGLHMAVAALGIGEGDEVITTPFSFVASSNCLLYERASPVFVDIEEETLGLDPDLVEDAATIAHARRCCQSTCSGGRAGSTAVESIARRRGGAVIEDACEALGSRLHDRPLGASATSPCSRSTRTSRSRPAKAAWS